MLPPNDHMDPIWEGDIERLFSNPYWILPPENSAKIGASWICKMNKGPPDESYNFGIDLACPASVKTWSRQIYLQIKSGNMPMTHKKEYLFPPEAVERFYRWITQGHRVTHKDPIVPTPIKFPTYEPPPFVVRKDIASLTEDELNAYRAAIDDKLNPTELGSKWQELCYIHTDWCLHYQEAFLPWHRAHLIYMESLIGCGIPYWNWMAHDASDPDSGSAGIPQAFFDKTYIHPTKGERDNPLRFALAKDGVSKKGEKCATRATELMPGASPDVRSCYIKKMNLYQRQILAALKEPLFSIPQGYIGTAGQPWANIPEFNPPQPDEPYEFDFRGKPIGRHFDNLLEQPHDNFHGWIGPDMADNSYTAFDPVFWSFHANMDRVFEMWIREHPTAQYTSSFPLRPFVGAHNSKITLSEGDPRVWIHTTIGDMTRNCKSLGYYFMPPKVTDLEDGKPDQISALGATDTMVLLDENPAASNSTTPSKGPRKAYVVFDGVRCADETFVIDVFLKDKSRAPLTETELESSVENPYFVGTSTRIGMGDSVSSDSKGKRCIKQGIRRFLPISLIPAEIKDLGAEQIEVVLKVTNQCQEIEVEEEAYGKMHGFTGKFFWEEPIITAEQERTAHKRDHAELGLGKDCCNDKS